MPRDQAPIDPNLIEYDSESRYIQSTSRAARRVKMKRGDSWLVRFLPAKLGPKGLWYARLGRHWLNQKPVYCPKHTAPDFGGDPDAWCPVCEEADRLNDSTSDAIKDIGWEGRAQAQWTTFCLVFEKSTGAGPIAVPDNEILLPYEFSHYKNSFEELMGFYRNHLRSSNPRSVLDWIKGSDFWANKTAKGIRLDRVEDARPALDNLVEGDPRIKKIEDGMKLPKVVMPTDKELQEFADKLHESAFSSAHRGGGAAGGGRSRSQTYTDIEEGAQETERLDEHDDNPPARTGRSRPAGRGRPAPPEEDQVPGAEYPAAEPTAEEPPDAQAIAEQEPPPEQPVEEGVEEPAPAPAPRRAAPAPAARTAPAPAQARAAAPPAARTAPAATRPAALPARPAAPRSAPAAAAPLAPRARPAPAPLPRGGTKDGHIDEGEELPEETTDAAPPAEESLPAEETAPPPVARPAPAGLGDEIRRRITGVQQRTTRA